MDPSPLSKVVLTILSDFKVIFGLAISLPKTNFFTSGLPELEVNNIKTVTCLSHGILSIRYLGLPLCTKKLSAINCAPFIQQIKGRLTSWTSKKNYRLQDD